MQDVVLAMLAKEPSHGYELRSRLRDALGPLGEAMNAGQIYVTLGRLEKAGLVTCEREPGLPDRPDRKVYALTPAGQQRVAGWLSEVTWPGPAPAEFHLKLVAAAAGGWPTRCRSSTLSAANCSGAARRAAGRDGGAGRLGRRAGARGRDPAAAGGPALA